jgi:YVTN family beta-propeller protein
MRKTVLGFVSVVVLAFSSLRADSVLTTIKVGGSSAGIAANPITNKIYVGVNQAVVVIDGKTQEITARIDTGGGVGFVSVNILTDRVYASSCNSGTCNIAVINGRTDTVIANIPTISSSLIGIQGLAVNPVTNRIYASAADDQQLIAIDGKTNTVIAQVFVPSQPGGIGVNPKTDRIYVAGSGFPGLIMVFDGATNTQIASIPEDFGVSNVATNFLLDRIYAPNLDKVIVADGATNQNITTVPAGPFANGVDVNLLNKKVYVTNTNGGSVTIIDGNTNQILQTLPLPTAFPDDVAVNLKNGLTYITSGDTDQVIVLQP